MHARAKNNGGKPGIPVVELEARPPVWCPQQSLQCTGEIHKHVAHQEEPEEVKKGRVDCVTQGFSGTKLSQRRVCH